jgi:16S rRNA processing protein RimM
LKRDVVKRREADAKGTNVEGAAADSAPSSAVPTARDPDTWIPLAAIARPHGVRGEVRLSLFNKSSDVLLAQEEVLVRLKDGEEHEVSVERARRADDAILMKLYSVDDRDRADELRGAQVCVRRRDFPPPEEGEFYAIDVVGAEARLGGERLGEVIEIMTYPTLETMLVRPDDAQGDWEIPLTDVYIAKVDATARVVEIVTLDELERFPVKKKKPQKPVARRDSANANANASTVSSGEDAEGAPTSSLAVDRLQDDTSPGED